MRSMPIQGRATLIKFNDGPPLPVREIPARKIPEIVALLYSRLMILDPTQPYGQRRSDEDLIWILQDELKIRAEKRRVRAMEKARMRRVLKIPVDQAWRLWWAGHMAAVGGKSLLVP
jgi:hypothetical protein